VFGGVVVSYDCMLFGNMSVLTTTPPNAHFIECL